MNHQTIIAKKIEFLNGHSGEDISPEMQAIVNADQQLRDELAFIESIWSNNLVLQDQQPSSNMDARFYQMLSQAQHSQSEGSRSSKARTQSHSLLERIRGLFAAQPVAQFALLTILFMGGWIAKDFSSQNPVNATAILEKQVESLNVMVALSMLQNHSTTERLAGVSYANNSQLDNSKITDVLFEILNQDRSNAVRLAVIDVLSKQAEKSRVRSQLVESLNERQSAMVQVSIARLLLNSHTRLNQSELLGLLNNKELNQEVIDYLQQYNQQQPNI